MAKKVGKVEEKKLVEETDIKWEISDLFSLLEDEDDLEFKSPDFCFGGVSWHLDLDYNGDGFMLYLCNDIVREYTVEYTVEYNFGLEKNDGSVEQLMNGILKGEQYEQDEGRFIKELEIRQRNSELVPSGTLIIRGRLKFVETVSSVQPSPFLDEPKLESLIKLDSLSENLRKIFVNKESCDTTLHVVDKEYKVHRAVLIAWSSVFTAMFQHETSEKQTGIISIPDCDPESFGEFLEFLYTGKLEKPSPRNALHLYETSEKYNVQELKAFCKKYLMKNLTVEILCDVVVIADRYEETNLLSAAQDFFGENFGEILDTSEWDFLVENNYRLSKQLLKEMSSKTRFVRRI